MSRYAADVSLGGYGWASTGASALRWPRALPQACYHHGPVGNRTEPVDIWIPRTVYLGLLAPGYESPWGGAVLRARAARLAADGGRGVRLLAAVGAVVMQPDDWRPVQAAARELLRGLP